MERIEFDRASLNSICSEHMVDKLYLFGSAASESSHTESDIDLLVKFKPFDLSDYFKNYLDFKNSLQAFFKRDVDLIEEQSLSNPYLIRPIDQNKRLIYG